MAGEEVRRYWKIFRISFLIFLIEIIGGFISGSLALLSDAGHIFVDTLAILISLAVAYSVAKNRFSEKRLRSWGAKINAVLLGALAIWIFREALQRIWKPEEILTGVMFWVALTGAALNYFQHRILKTAESREQHITHKAISLHVLSDLGQSLAVVAASLLIKFTGWLIADPILSMIVAALMFYWSVKLLFSKN